MSGEDETAETDDYTEESTAETTSAIEALQSTREESRAVLDQQVTALSTIDDIAMRNARTAIIVLGIVASVALAVAQQTAGGSIPALVLVVGTAGVVALLGAILFGIGTVSITTAEYGIGASYRAELREEDYTEREWLETLLAGYDEWTAAMDVTIVQNVQLLEVVQYLLLFGIALLLAAVALFVATA
jgi:hypothetical protein